VVFLTYLWLEFLHRKKKILKMYATAISCFKSFICMMQSLSGNRMRIRLFSKLYTNAVDS